MEGKHSNSYDIVVTAVAKAQDYPNSFSSDIAVKMYLYFCLGTPIIITVDSPMPMKEGMLIHSC